MVSTPASLTQVCHLPIPITVPYSACFSSACTATGQRQIIAMNARKAMERDDRMRVDCVRVGLLEVDMMEGERWMFEDKKDCAFIYAG